MAVPVSLRTITKRFGDTAAVDRLDLEIPEGELFFLLGPSGCGKTTLLRAVAGFYHPDEGEIYFGERRVTGEPPHRRNAAMVFQNYALWPHMSVYQNVEYGLNIRKVAADDKKRRVEKALDIVQMLSYAKRNPNQLSGGQQQRVALARAIVIEPDVLLLDEPLSNLDAKLRDEMRQEIKRIHNELRVTAIYVTHDQKEALSLADRIALMREGRLVQVGSPREIYTEPANVFAAHFVGETNFIEGVVQKRSERGLELATDIGLIRTERTGDFQPGEKAVLSLRPESIVTDAAADGEANRFEAVVKSSAYLGHVAELLLEAQGGAELRAAVFNPGAGGAFRAGKQTSASFSPKDAIPLRPDEEKTAEDEAENGNA